MTSSHNQEQSTLAARLRERIRLEGAITFRDWMAAALYDEREGYYSRKGLKRWGRAGDYRTSPERSPLFGATFARYFANLHEELGAPNEWTIFEAGAGEGDFAYWVLRTLERDYPHVFYATRYVIDEISRDAHERASLRLESFSEQIKFRQFVDTNTPVQAGIVFSNELLDAFPVHRVTVQDGKLLELFVGLSERGDFVWLALEPSTRRINEYLARSSVTLYEGQTAEVNLEIDGWMRKAVGLFQHGYVITVDYGAEANDLYHAPHRLEGTLRSFRRHQLTEDVLANPGEQDLTTTVDWTQVMRVGEELGLRTVCFERQDQFLLRAGLLDQLERMSGEKQDDADALILRSSVRELILPGGMNDSFQVLVQIKENRQD